MTHYGISREFDPNYMRVEYAREELIHAATKDLIKRIADGKLHTVRLIETKPVARQNYYDTLVEIRFEYEVMDVQVEHYKAVEFTYDYMSWGELSFTALGEMKKRIKNKWKSFWSKKK